MPRFVTCIPCTATGRAAQHRLWVRRIPRVKCVTSRVRVSGPAPRRLMCGSYWRAALRTPVETVQQRDESRIPRIRRRRCAAPRRYKRPQAQRIHEGNWIAIGVGIHIEVSTEKLRWILLDEPLQRGVVVSRSVEVE